MRELLTARPEWFAELGPDPAITLLGRGESYAAWLVRSGSGSQTRVVRLARRPAGELPADPALESAALQLAPPGIGPAPYGWGRDVMAEIGRPEAEQWPYFVLSLAPGRVWPTTRWSRDADLRARVMRQFAALHTRTWPGAGPVATADENAESLSLAVELAAMLDFWRGRWPAGLAARDITQCLDPIRERIDRADESARELRHFSLVHGDPCLTNIVIDEAGAARLIDWEWARIGDPARDLAFLGGAIHAEPWYAALTDADIEHDISVYVEAAGPAATAQLGGPVAIRHRRDAWLILEALGVLLYSRWRIEDPAQQATDRHHAVAAQLAPQLAALLPV